jgi:cytochrome bd-type quinol oxidase subunit 2
MKWKEGIKSSGLGISAGLAVLGTSYAVLKNPERLDILKELSTNKAFLAQLVIIIGFCIFIFFQHDGPDNQFGTETDKVKQATKHALIAFIIGILGELGLKVSHFWLVFIVAYYLDLGE